MNPTTIRKPITPTSLSWRPIGSVAIFACCLCLTFPPALGAPGSWTQKKNLPMARAGAAACAADGILYVVGGDEPGDTQEYRQTKTLFAYDPGTDSWTQKRDMPTARRFPGVAVVDGIVYVIGGGGIVDPATDAVEAYDPKTDTWTTKASLPAPRSAVAACAANGILYAIGGITGVSPNVGFLDTVEAYDPENDQWTPKSPLPKPAASFSAYLVNGFIHFFSGKDTFVYDPSTDRWSNKSPIPNWSLVANLNATGTADGILYLFGGESSAHKGTTFTLAYDPVQDRFIGKRMIPVPIEGAACAAIDGRIYLAGGADKSPPIYSDAVIYDNLWVFDPQGGVAPQFLSLTRESPSSVRLLWQGEAGRLYGVQSKPHLTSGLWLPFVLSTGTNVILATNDVVEATGAVPATDTQRFFRVLEAN
jgi:hypothetical protein